MISQAGKPSIRELRTNCLPLYWLERRANEGANPKDVLAG
jgi:hypothetical protein